MPTITLIKKDLEALSGKRFSLKEIERLLEYGKGELASYDEKSDELKLEFQDTNMPYLWSAEGVSRLFRGILGKQTGLQIPRFLKSRHSIIVDPSIESIRPHIGAFVAEGAAIDEQTLQQLISLQEKLAETYGRQRRKVSLGIYKCDAITFPVTYKAADPDSVSFIPLDFNESMTLRRILHEHPKGKEYGHLVQKHSSYPLLIDSMQEVLSFPPIINSNTTGRVQPGDTKILVEATGTDYGAVQLSLIIFAFGLADRGFSLSSISVRAGSRIVQTPHIERKSLRISKDDVASLLGVALQESQIKTILERFGYGVQGMTATPPLYRKDILHPRDVIEDIAIGYGYEKLEGIPLSSYTQPLVHQLVAFIDVCRDLMIGFGFQEVQSPLLTNPLVMSDSMRLPAKDLVQLKNPMSETYSAVRNSLLPQLLEFASKNKHQGYPQSVFEEGPITSISQPSASNGPDPEHLAAVLLQDTANYTHMKQILEAFFRALGATITPAPFDHPSFIPGRCAEVVLKKRIGYFGEIHPEVLEAFAIGVPCIGFELDLSSLFSFRNRK